MTWIYLDDGFPEHPKVIAAGGDAAWLYVCALGYVNRNLSDGQVPKVVVARVSDRKRPEKLAEKLVEVGLWEDKGDHFYVHDYHEWNRSAEMARRKKEERSENARKAAQARWHGHTPPADGDAKRNADAYAGASADAMPEHVPEQSGSNASGKGFRNAEAMPPRVGARAAPTPTPSNSSRSEERLGASTAAAPPPAAETENFNDETPGLVDYLAQACKIDQWPPKRQDRFRREATRVVAHLQAHVDDRIIDETIGRFAELDTPPVSPNYLLVTVRNWAAENQIQIPDIGATP